MIARIDGNLESLDSRLALVAVDGGLTYEVLVSAYAAGRMGGSIGRHITLHTLYYIEAQSQGATMMPRLAGFLSVQDRAFFELFTTCRGIGYRKALRAMTLRTDQIAAAIADRDRELLQSLPEVGKRTAETIIATLNGKVDHFVSPQDYGAKPQAAFGVAAGEMEVVGTGTSSLAREALEALVVLGENRVQALQWIDRVLRDADQAPLDVSGIINQVYRIKEGS